MKRYSFFLALTALMVFSFGLAHGQTSIQVSNVTGTYLDGVGEGKAVKWTMSLTFITGDGDAIVGSTNGFRVWTTNNGPVANFGTATADTLPLGWKPNYYSGELFINTWLDGGLEDTVGFGGYDVSSGGIPDGFNQDVWWVEAYPSTEGDTLCIDSTWYPPGGDWLWSTNLTSYFPGWSGPHCYHVYHIPDPPPEITDCPGTLNKDHCVHANVQLTVYNEDENGDPGQAYTATLLPGDPAGDAISQAGNKVDWDYDPSLADVTLGPYTICIEVVDGAGGADTCCFNVVFTNTGPVFTGGCGETVLVTMGNSASHTVSASDDCDPFWFYICGVTPTPVGSYSIDANTGELTFNTDVADGGILYDFTVGVTDGVDSTCDCHVFFDVLTVEPHLELWIDKIHKQIQGQHAYVPVVYHDANVNAAIGGFDILIAFDRTGLNLQTVIPGPLFDIPGPCEWEYFTYRWYFWPSYFWHWFWGGIVRVVGIAEMNNGLHHPNCGCLPQQAPYWAEDDIVEGYDPWPPAYGYELFTIDFLVTDNRQFECMFVPMFFFWNDCGDNALSDCSGDTLYIEERVYTFDTAYGGRLDEPVNPDDSTFPSYFGLMEYPECLEGGKRVPIPNIYFYDGGVDIACADSIDARGDINLNGMAYEIADAVVFTNYFIYGFSAFHISVDGQTAASDVNADGLALTVGDLVYLIRVIVGDEFPMPKPAPVEASYVVDEGVISVDAEMGAALVMVEGNVTPTLLADNMDIKYAYNGDENVTRVLVYSLEGNSFSGEFLNAAGNVVSIEMGAYNGAVAKLTEIPADFALNQNYPNPFNPVTTISFNLPSHSEYTLTIYNVTGQQVTEFIGEHEAGTVSIDVDASNWASGVYFYKLNAGDFSATKKMVLLK